MCQYVWPDGVPAAVLGVAGIPGFFIQRPKKIEDTAQGYVTLPRLRRELQRLLGQQWLVVGGPNALRAMVQVDLGSDAASGQTKVNLDALRPLIQKAYSLVNLGFDDASGLHGISGQQCRP